MSFVPLSELQGERVNLQLPEYVPTEEIGINLTRIDRLANLGGFALGETTVSTFQGGTTEHDVSVIGRNADGTAIAGAVRTRKAELGRGTFEEHDSYLSYCHSRPPLTVQINHEEIAQRLSQAGKVRNAHAWAAQLDTAIAHGLRRASWEHYVKRPDYQELFPASVLILGYTAHLLATGIDSSTPAVLATGIAVYNSVKLVDAISNRAVDPREVCYSFAPMIHPDRALAVGALASMLPLVKRI